MCKRQEEFYSRNYIRGYQAKESSLRLNEHYEPPPRMEENRSPNISHIEVAHIFSDKLLLRKEVLDQSSTSQLENIFETYQTLPLIVDSATIFVLLGWLKH